jgi:hypothetical protein
LTRASLAIACALVVSSVLAGQLGCSASGSPEPPGGAGAAASGGEGGAGGTADGGGTGGILLDGSSGSAGKDATQGDGPGVTQDGAPDVDGEACLDGGYAPGPLARVCAAATDDECDGTADIEPSLPNQGYGNGFDDDCDGRVDEGCACPPGVASGGTRPCWVVPGSQIDSGGAAVGWCATNSVGTVKCVTVGTGENPAREWDGECRGAQPPFPDDVCAPGDFDCDGLDANSKTEDCSCGGAEVECPTTPAVTTPYPDRTHLPWIDGKSWIKTGNPTAASNWKWTATGGDCDNILPHPSFALFNGPDATFLVPVGVQQGGLGPNANQVGWVWGPGPGVGSDVFPAFALSGDYLVKGEFDLGGKHHECTIKVQVRAPGIRAELCWAPMPNDVDLHLARLQNADACSADALGHGWFQTCRTDDRADDCYYLTASGCTGFGANPSPWGYSMSAPTACHGWGSRRDIAEQCDNPRLDFDNVSCDPAQINPDGFLGLSVDFCGAENINLDNPKNGEKFAFGVHAYSIGGEVKPHLNLYCNGERRLSLGYDPTAGVDFPRLSESVGTQSGGDFWSAAVVEAVVDTGGTLTDCAITPVHSLVPKPAKDGSTDFCVDTHPQNGVPGDERDWKFESAGGHPATPDGFCWH